MESRYAHRFFTVEWPAILRRRLCEADRTPAEVLSFVATATASANHEGASSKPTNQWPDGLP